ncbi:sensor histidine kinase [Microbacterium sp. VKM Ac-2870]|uniref:sensor histidine kinase n=1 Tax=Microbacterium sp. VKM Ac-2870 TaxID=2783825 RepID=UPI00188CC26D|nr:sensor histidine kinase [Microbacterium sp. VKM Ac-2870]MBF4562567.1 sensor histidine kinase [Microbacterium sp. VKM Ac-2870]
MTATRDELNGPGWYLHPGPASSAPPTPRELLTTRAARGWYVGASISLTWFFTVAPDVVGAATSPLSTAVAVTLLVLFAASFLLVVPLSRGLRVGRRLIPAAGLFLLSFTLFPWIGWDIRGLWSYVGVAIGMAVVRLRTTWMLLLSLGAAALVAGVIGDGWTESVLFLPAIIVSISAMMAAFGRTIAAMNALRATRDQMAAMAVERERSRVARDLHDILGHSLTVITVKTELAGRLIDVDPARARTEIGEVEALARGALADVRTTVAGYRGVSVAGELAAARAALDAAGIAAELPTATENVSAERRELAGWIVREGVTNVIRHAHATRCRVRLTARGVSIEDDGVGPASDAAFAGSGLIGLRERVEAAGGRLTLGRSELGGFLLRVAL